MTHRGDLSYETLVAQKKNPRDLPTGVKSHGVLMMNTDQYLSGLPKVQQDALQHLRETIASLVPEAVESISTNVPAFRYRGKYLVSFSAAKDHLALLVMQGDAMKSLSDELKTHNVGSRIIRFTPERPLPTSLIEKVVRFRQSEIDMRSSPRP